jgi:hypothetical protein
MRRRDFIAGVGAIAAWPEGVSIVVLGKFWGWGWALRLQNGQVIPSRCRRVAFGRLVR